MTTCSCCTAAIATPLRLTPVRATGQLATTLARLARFAAAAVAIAGLAASGPAFAKPPGEPADPLASPSWPDVRRKLLGDAPLVFDSRVTVLAPEVAEDSLNVPVTVSLAGLPEVRRVLVVADLNPILKVLEFEPLRAVPRLSFRLKLQQGSPVRALAQTADGTWHAGGVWVDAAGGGCTAPSMGRSTGNWADTLGEVDARWWRREDGQRLKFRVMHPMDTGLAPGIPAFYLERLALRDAAGNDWVRIATYEPLSENPLFALEFDGPTPELTLIGVDNNGNRIRAGVSR
jgi:sulfur-oxidizing protein SoxY